MNKQAWMKQANTYGIKDLEIYEQRSTSTSIALFEGNVDQFTISDVDGVAVRGIYEEHMGSCFLEDVSDESIDYALHQIIDQAKNITSDDVVELYAGDVSYPELEKKVNHCLEKDSNEKIEILKQLEQALLESDTRVSQVAMCRYQEVQVSRSIVNSKGLDLYDESSYSLFVTQIVVKDQDDVKSDFDWKIIYDLSEFDVKQFANDLVKRACDKLHATQVPSATYPVLLHHTAMSDLLEALCGLFNGENAYKGISILKDSLGKQIFDEKITLVDDPHYTKGYSTFAFDDEGVATKKKVVVENGVLKTYLHNLKSAKLMNTSSTGNGFKSGYRGNVGISPTNFYIEAGNESYEEIISKMDQGIIINDITGLHAGINTVSTEFSIQSSGFYVENGKIVKPINLITIAGNFLEMMKHVETVGSDLTFSPSGVGTPSILFQELAVSGE